MYDASLELKDAGAVTSSGYGEVGGEAAVVELGEGKVNGRMIVDVSAIEIADNDELYVIHLMGGDDESFTNTVSLGSIELGANEVLEGNVDSEIGRYEMPMTNEQNGTIYPYLRVRHVISGTVGTGINYAAYLGRM